jgi:hypothetical protein
LHVVDVIGLTIKFLILSGTKSTRKGKLSLWSSG